jgi:hypothetical protein
VIYQQRTRKTSTDSYVEYQRYHLPMMNNTCDDKDDTAYAETMNDGKSSQKEGGSSRDKNGPNPEGVVGTKTVQNRRSAQERRARPRWDQVQKNLDPEAYGARNLGQRFPGPSAQTKKRRPSASFTPLRRRPRPPQVITPRTTTTCQLYLVPRAMPDRSS